MDLDTALAVNLISDFINNGHDSKVIEKAGRILATYAKVHGLTDENLNLVADAIRCGKSSGPALSQLFRCLIPESRMSEQVLLKMLAWTFSKLGTLGPSLERLVFSWFGDLLEYDLCNKEDFQKYYYDFFLALRKHQHLEMHACAVLYYISQECDAKKFIVQPLYDLYRRGSTQQVGSLLSIFGEFRNEVHAGIVGVRPMRRPHSSYQSGMLNAVSRIKAVVPLNEPQSNESGRTFRLPQKDKSKESRLIPSAEYAQKRTSFIIQFPSKELASLQHRVTISTPTQMMSILANHGSFESLLAADRIHQVRLLYNIEATLRKVFLMELQDVYFTNEKKFLLVSLAALQEYLNFSIPGVSSFLLKFLRIWDGQEYSREVHALIEWLTFESLSDWDIAASVFRVLFRSCDTASACALLSTLTMMLRNIVAASNARRADVPPPINVVLREIVDISQLYMAVGKLIGEMVVERVSFGWAEDQILVTHALYFYQAAVSMETEGDLCAFLLLPFPLVYNVIFSSHRGNIDHLCQLLVSYAMQVERLHRLGIFEDFEKDIDENLGIYMMDLYRALFKNSPFKTDLHPGVFNEEFLQATADLKPLEGFSIKNKSNITWWVPSTSVPPADKFPGISAFKTLIESKLAELDDQTVSVKNCYLFY